MDLTAAYRHLASTAAGAALLLTESTFNPCGGLSSSSNARVGPEPSAFDYSSPPPSPPDSQYPSDHEEESVIEGGSGANRPDVSSSSDSVHSSIVVEMDASTSDGSKTRKESAKAASKSKKATSATPEDKATTKSKSRSTQGTKATPKPRKTQEGLVPKSRGELEVKKRPPRLSTEAGPSGADPHPPNTELAQQDDGADDDAGPQPQQATPLTQEEPPKLSPLGDPTKTYRSTIELLDEMSEEARKSVTVLLQSVVVVSSLPTEGGNQRRAS